MAENPYQAPPTDDTSAAPTRNREDLRRVARAQKGVLMCILFYLIALIGRFVFPAELQILIGIGVVLVGFVGAIFVFILAMRVYGTVFGIVLGLLSLIPLINLLVLLMVNGKATSILKQQGIQVGLLGANLSEI